MPFGDGTGPQGFGPMTGRAAGYCAGYGIPGYMNPAPGRGWGAYGWGGRGRGRGWGRGRGRGFGRGWRWAHVAPAPYAPYPPDPYAAPVNPYAYEAVPPSAAEESQILREQAKAMQDELNSILQRIDSSSSP